jgi:hypothetical protein
VNDEMRNLLAQYLRNNAETIGGYRPPPGPDDGGPDLPQVSAQSQFRGTVPKLSGEYGIPVGEGDVSVRGDFYRPSPQAPAYWGARVGYHRKF